MTCESFGNPKTGDTDETGRGGTARKMEGGSGRKGKCASRRFIDCFLSRPRLLLEGPCMNALRSRTGSRKAGDKANPRGARSPSAAGIRSAHAGGRRPRASAASRLCRRGGGENECRNVQGANRGGKSPGGCLNNLSFSVFLRSSSPSAAR